MRRALSHNLVPYDPEIEQTLAKIRKAKRIEAQAMAEENNHRAIRDYFKPVLNEHYSGIARQPIEPNNFELKPALINMVQQNQFGGSPIDDPNTHLSMFLEICDTIKINGVAHDTVKLRLFPFSLRDKARSWLHSLQPGSIVTWEEMAQKFLAKFFPPAKTALLRTEIGTFKQHDFEPLYESWERFKDLLRRCPQHGYQDWLQIQLFYNGLNGQTRTIVDAAAGGTLLSKTAMEAHTLLEEMASNNYQWPNERNIPRKIAGIHETDQFTALSAQISALSNQFATLTAQGAPQAPSPSTESVAMASATYQGVDPTMEQAQFVNNRNFNYRGNQLPNYYHPGLRNHENLSYGNNRNVLQPPPGYNNQVVEKKPSLEDHLAAFITETRSRFNKSEARLDSLETHMSNVGATMKSLEVQIGQLASSININQKGKFPSDT